MGGCTTLTQREKGKCFDHLNSLISGLDCYFWSCRHQWLAGWKAKGVAQALPLRDRPELTHTAVESTHGLSHTGNSSTSTSHL